MPLFNQKFHRRWFQIALVAGIGSLLIAAYLTHEFVRSVVIGIITFAIFGGFQVFWFPDE